jgi:PAS domain S-box-containing protein
MDPSHAEAARRALFQIVKENTADMIALVDGKGRRLYNSPASKRTRGYSAAELGGTSAFEQIQLDDRSKVLESGTRGAQHGHKGKSWSTIRDEKGEVARIRSQDTLSDRRRQADVIAVLGIRRAEQSKP